jgi:hypothetical protein
MRFSLRTCEMPTKPDARRCNKRSLWEEMRNLFHAFSFDSMAALLEAIIVGFVRQKPILNSS